MNSAQQTGFKSLVLVIEDLATAKSIFQKLIDEGFSSSKLKIVTHSVRQEAPQVQSTYNGDTMAFDMIRSSVKWSAIGAAIGLTGAIFVPIFVGLGMVAIGGLAGGAIGGIAGADDGRDDDAVDLPSVEDYEQLIGWGNCLLVVSGTHDCVHRAAELIERMPYAMRHISKLHGHEFHEHPVRYQDAA